MTLFGRWERGSRFYEAEVIRDLFSTPCVVLTWGGVNTAACRRLTRPYASSAAASAAFVSVSRRRLVRGYVLKGGSDDSRSD